MTDYRLSPTCWELQLRPAPERVVAERYPRCRPCCGRVQHHLGLDPVGGVVAAREELCDLLGREPAGECAE